MEWKDVGKAIGKVAPLLGTVLGGPVTGGAVSMLCSAFGLKNDASPEDVMKSIKMTPEAAVKLKEIESNNQIQLQQIALQVDQAYLQDRSDARKREVEIAKATGKRDINLYVLAWVVVVLFFALVGLLIFVELPKGSLGYINQLFGSIATGFGMILSYFFGTNKSSSEKTNASNVFLKEMMKKLKKKEE